MGKVWGNHSTVRNCEKWEMWLSIRDNVAVELFERRVKDGAQMLVEADEAVCCAQLSKWSVCWETVHDVMGSGHCNTDDKCDACYAAACGVASVGGVNVERRADSIS